MAIEIAMQDPLAGPTGLGLPFVGERPLADFERRRGERWLARRRWLWVSRPAALGVAGVVLLSWLVPQVRLDFYRDSELSLLALGGVVCLGGALITFRGLGTEVKNLRLDLANDRVVFLFDEPTTGLQAASACFLGRAVDWEILPRSRFLWTEQGKAARWRSERKGNGTPDSVAPGERDLRKRMGKEWSWIRPALRSPRGLLAVAPIGCLALSIAAFWAMPAVPTPSQFCAPFLWAAAALLGGAYFSQNASNEPELSAIETGESRVPHSKEPAPPTGEVFRRTLLLSERDQVARLITSQADSGGRVALSTLVLGWIATHGDHPDRWWILGLALFVLFAPYLVSGFYNAWAVLQLRRDLREGTVIVGRSASHSGEIEWLARSRFVWTEDGEPVAWRGE